MKSTLDWTASPVEIKRQRLCELLLETPGYIEKFRRTFLAAGRIEWPDAPLPRHQHLEWGDHLPCMWQRLKGARQLFGLARRLYMYKPFKLSEIADDMVGRPSFFKIPGMQYQFTELAIRRFHVAREVRSSIQNLGRVLEIGGGFGAVASALVKDATDYYLVELPDTVPLAKYYLSEKGLLGRIKVIEPWELEQLHESFDTLINTLSFQHMDERNLRFYFGQAERLRIHQAFLINRNVKRDPSDVPIDDYPIPSSWRLVRDEKWLWTDIHRQRVYSR